MNILDKIKTILDLPNIKLGLLPDKPDTAIGLFEYSGVPPNHHFSGTDYAHGVQVRCRSNSPAEAHYLATQVQAKLNRYHDNEISVLQATAILDIGRDEHQRQEYTVNFTVYKL